MQTRLLRFGFPLIAAAFAACVSDRPTPAMTSPEPPPGRASTPVRITNFAYVLADITVPRGTVVEWTNEDAANHTVTADNESFDSNPFKQNEKYRLTANQAGTFTYFCQIHPFMKAKLTVTP